MSREELKSEIETIICDFKSYDETINDTSEKIMQLFAQYEKETQDKVELYKSAWRAGKLKLKGEDLYLRMQKVEPQKIDYQPEKASLGNKLFGLI